MRVLQIGNFEPPHSTENELRDALGRLPGVQVEPIQEQHQAEWDWLISELQHSTVDMVLWTSTRGLNAQVDERTQDEMLHTARERGVPTVGYHLDRWWGLHANKRQEQMWASSIPIRGADGGRFAGETIGEARRLLPFFGVEYLFTADGGHQKEWADVGVNHIWMPPGVSERWCYLAEPDRRYECDIAFVGAWENYGHTEWTHRHEMIAKVRGWYGDRFRCYPKSGQPRITMGDLNTIYASAKVVIGDSCLVPNDDGSPCTHYCSDRIPETLGRGGILIHPRVEGLDMFGEMIPWELGDWDDLHSAIEAMLAAYPERGWPVPGGHVRDYRLYAIEEVKAHNTYTRRMASVLEQVTGWTP